MKLVIEKAADLQALYVKQLRQLVSAEELIAIKSQLLRDVASDPELRQIFSDIWQFSQTHAIRSRELLGHNTSETRLYKCKVIYALFDEAENTIQEMVHDSVRNTALVAVARRILHYQIAVYDALRQFAHTLECFEDARILEEALADETEADRRLANIAERISVSARKVA